MMKKIGVFCLTIMLLITIAAVWQPAPVESAKKSTNEDVLRLTRDIQSLNLINCLYLTDDQMKQLLPLVQESARMEQELRLLKDKQSHEMTGVFREMRSQLMSNADLTEDTKKKYHTIMNPVEKELTDYRDKMTELSEKALGILNENQKVMLSEYKPCLVPRKNVTHPERIGQAGNSEKFGKMLDKVRTIPEANYDKAKAMILERAKERIRFHYKTEKERSDALQRVSTAMDKVRTLSDSDYQMQKDEITESIPLPDKKFQGRQLENHNLLFASRFLLNPSNVEILQHKMNASGK